MASDDTHPMTVFLNEVGGGDKVAYLPPTEKFPDELWIFDWMNAGYHLNFTVGRREEDKVLEVRGRDIQWIGRKIYNKEMELVQQPCEQVQKLVDESVEIREEPIDVAAMHTSCTGCSKRYSVEVMPKMDLLIDGYPAYRVFEEQCPKCGKQLVDKVVYPSSEQREYYDSVSEVEDLLWPHSRRP